MATLQTISPNQEWIPGKRYSFLFAKTSVTPAIDRLGQDSLIARFRTDPRLRIESIQSTTDSLTINVKAVGNASPIMAIALLLVGAAAIYGLFLTLRAVREILDTGTLKAGGISIPFLGIAAAVIAVFIVFKKV